MKKNIYIVATAFGLGVLFTIACLNLSADNLAKAAKIFNYFGDCFLWFFTKLTTSYFSILPKIWSLWSSFGTIWANPSFITIVFGVLMIILVGLVCVIFSAILIIIYALMFLFFIVVLLIILLLSCIIFFFSVFVYAIGSWI